MAARKHPAIYDKGFAHGVALACSIVQKSHDQPTMLAEVLEACGFDRKTLKRLGVSAHDLRVLRPVFAEMKE